MYNNIAILVTLRNCILFFLPFSLLFTGCEGNNGESADFEVFARFPPVPQCSVEVRCFSKLCRNRENLVMWLCPCDMFEKNNMNE